MNSTPLPPLRDSPKMAASSRRRPFCFADIHAASVNNVISNVYQHREQIYETRHRISFIYLFIFNTQLMGNMGEKKEIELILPKVVANSKIKTFGSFEMKFFCYKKRHSFNLDSVQWCDRTFADMLNQKGKGVAFESGNDFSTTFQTLLLGNLNKFCFECVYGCLAVVSLCWPFVYFRYVTVCPHTHTLVRQFSFHFYSVELRPTHTTSDILFTFIIITTLFVLCLSFENDTCAVYLPPIFTISFAREKKEKKQ